MNCVQRTKVSGFTLMELLVTIALLGLFASFAVPSFIGFLAQQRVQSNARNITNLLSFSRSEAVRLNLPVDVCPLNVNSSSLETSGCKSSANWTSGLLAYADITNTGKDGYALEKAVRRVLFDSGQVVVTGAVYRGTQKQGDDTSKLLTFFPGGTYGDGVSFAKFLIKAKSDASICRVVILEASGRSKSCLETIGDCTCDLP